MQQKVIITSEQTEINKELTGGWKVIQIIPQPVSIHHGAIDSSVLIVKPAIRGYFCFLLEKPE